MIHTFHSFLPLLNETLHRGGFPPSVSAYERSSKASMPVDILEDETHYHFIFELPGIPKEDIKIETVAGILTVQAEKKRGDESLPLQRKFKLPQDANLESSEARLENGLLHLSFGKAIRPEPRQISIA